ncbi:unnamed protein product [Boreogadus saida]
MSPMRLKDNPDNVHEKSRAPSTGYSEVSATGLFVRLSAAAIRSPSQPEVPTQMLGSDRTPRGRRSAVGGLHH